MPAASTQMLGDSSIPNVYLFICEKMPIVRLFFMSELISPQKHNRDFQQLTCSCFASQVMVEVLNIFYTMFLT